MADGGHERDLRWSRLAIFSLPVLLIQAIELPWRVYLPSFLTGPLGFGLAVAGTLLAAVRLFDGGFDLFVGWASDRWPTRFGRRKPWMAAGVPLIMAGAAGVFLARPGTSLVAVAAWAFLMHAGYTMVVTPHGGWGLEIGRTPGERLRVVAVKTWFAALAMPVVLLVPSVLERAFAADRTLQLRSMGVAILVLAPGIVAVVLGAVREAPGAATCVSCQPRRLGLLERVAATARQPDCARIACLYVLAGLTEATQSGSFIFFVEGPLGLKGWAGSLLFLQAAIAVAALPGWTWLAARIGKRQALSLAFAAQAVASGAILAAPFVWAPMTLPLLAVRYACWGADFLLLRAMVADLAGNALAGGRNRSASHYAAFNVTLRISMSLGAGIVLWIPALLGTDPSGGEAFDDAARLTFALPASFCALCGLYLTSALALPRFGIAVRRSL